jgi:hypothetical protein
MVGKKRWRKSDEMGCHSSKVWNEKVKAERVYL